MRNTPIRRSTKPLRRESEKHRLKRLAEQSKPVSERTRKGFSTITAPRKAIKKVNPERQAKRRKSYAQKLAAYKRSETYLIVAQRSRGFCEMVDCMERDALHHHHRTYSRFGGGELPEDIQVLCKAHHELVESQHPTRNRNYSSR